MSVGGHCIHSTGQQAELRPGAVAVVVEYCCLCGDERTVYAVQTWEGHGPYLRFPVLSWARDWNSNPCKRAEPPPDLEKLWGEEETVG